MSENNVFYAQSGGVTSVINASAAGVIETVRANSQAFGKVYAGKNGILGALKEELIDTSFETDETIAQLKHTPGGAFGSCRYKLKCMEQNRAEYQRLIDVFDAHQIRYFFYNGGGDSQDTAHKVASMADSMGYPITCIGIPKTVDNDLPLTDCCPGFGSVAKYVAVSVREAGLDVASMCETSTKVFVLEVMGRHAGWIAAGAGLAKAMPHDPPHLILFPEVAFDEAKFLSKVQATVADQGYAVVVVSEGVKDKQGRFLADAGGVDAFGHKQLGGVAPQIAQLIKQKLGFKYHWAVSDYLQRSARHIASAVDVEQAYAVGKAAVEFALAGKKSVLPVIVRESDSPYRWSIASAPLADVANVEKPLPKDYISEDGFSITEKARTYLRPLIQGEADLPFDEDGLPKIARLKGVMVKQKLTQMNQRGVAPKLPF